ncbi:hypothetical protein TSTA_057810 [Talaromyces stipitatus ATCC 10500]|uniref:Starter acyltransferase (SAT) domain-containing protein n=1 Tax=Talaromyces stipitatus (strain ATCC 10500 / CBS 375.48 / QM 6759 / NRRL 1006) TaxID=441959 RepID=B8MRV8_TALSN|nr:uncharacterized protein TSTA_057810 [Talaromyces stipitatus ATCC 10500]EED13292.1 hypothetical protein TSTA_057810 [Talaromyces stipitatus ATCC 10500]
MVPGSASTEAVRKFGESVSVPFRPYISANASNGITVSGLPLALTKLIQSEMFCGLRHKKIPIYGPYHAIHLYSEFYIDRIVDDLATISTEQRVLVFSETWTKEVQ